MTDDNRKLVLIGGGGHALVVAEAAISAGWTLIGFLDDRTDADLAGHAPRLGGLGAIDRLDPGVALHVAVGELALRRRLMAGLRGWFATIVHPTAWVSPTATLSAGSFVGAFAAIQGRARLGPHTIVNTGAIVEHDVTISENTHLAPRSVLLGAVRVGAHSMIGAGAVVLPEVRLGVHVTVGAGAVVRKDVPDGSTVVGVPARDVAMDL
jgi:acetyltransferase EpsM